MDPKPGPDVPYEGLAALAAAVLSGIAYYFRSYLMPGASKRETDKPVCTASNCPLSESLEAAESSLSEIKARSVVLTGKLEMLMEWHNCRDADGTFTWHNKFTIEQEIKESNRLIQSQKEVLLEVKQEVRNIADASIRLSGKVEDLAEETAQSQRELREVVLALQRLIGG